MFGDKPRAFQIVGTHMIPIDRLFLGRCKIAQDHHRDGAIQHLADVLIGDVIGMQNQPADPTRQGTHETSLALQQAITATDNDGVIVIVGDILHGSGH